MKIFPKNNKVLFFSDLHLGIHQNSSTWHNICLQLAEWIRSVMVEHGLDTIFFAGDVFHDRHEIGVNTLYVAKKFFDILKDFNVHLIPGNHDAFLHSTVEVNSVEILSRPNVFVYSEPTTIGVLDKRVTFCPWKTSIKNLTKVDMLIGHFEIPNFKMNPTKICDKGESKEDMFERADAVVTGHFHYREFRSYDSKYVLYLGSPYEMDFSDREQPKGLSIIDFNNLQDIIFIQNNITPKHFRLKVSELQTYYSRLSTLVEGNIVSIYVDQKIDMLTLNMLQTKISQYKPLSLRTEFDILETAQTKDTDIKKLSFDIESAFAEFIDHVDTRATKKEVLEKCLYLLRTCQTSYE